jgi:hypothetical protein
MPTKSITRFCFVSCRALIQQKCKSIGSSNPCEIKDGCEYRVRTCEEYRLATRTLQQQQELSTYFRDLEREYEKVVSFRMRLRETSTGEVDA